MWTVGRVLPPLILGAHRPLPPLARAYAAEARRLRVEVRAWAQAAAAAACFLDAGHCLFVAEEVRGSPHLHQSMVALFDPSGRTRWRWKRRPLLLLYAAVHQEELRQCI